MGRRWERSAGRDSKSYTLTRPAALDEHGVLWLSTTTQASDDAFFRELVRLMFEPDAPAHCAHGLREALSLRLANVAVRTEGESVQLHLPTDGDVVIPPDDEPVEPGGAHGPVTVNPARNLPTAAPLTTTMPAPPDPPGPRPKDGSGDSSSTSRHGSTKPSKKRAPRAEVPLERQQIGELKAEQYAWHCQICLGSSEPAALAPAGSYIEYAEPRQKLMEAHHIDHVRMKGARHAGNLLLLCMLHHRNQGDHLTRERIREALRKGGTRARRIFTARGRDPVLLDGLVIETSSSESAGLVRVFFTDEHAKVWMASSD